MNVTADSDLRRTVLAFRLGILGGKSRKGGDDVSEHLGGHVHAQGRNLLDALWTDFGGVDRAVVGVNGLGEAKPQVPNPVDRN